MATTTNLKAGQLVRINDPRSLAYGRVAMVMTAKGKGRSLVRFADLPKTESASPNPAGFTETFATSDLTLVANVPIAALYLLVKIVERNGDRRHTHQCLAHSNEQEQATLANSVACSWHGDDGHWDKTKAVWQIAKHHFVLAEDWRELSMAEYINLAADLTDCTPDNIGESYGENTEAEYIRRQTGGLN